VVGGMVQNYNPRTNQVQEGSLGDRSDIVAVMAVGFGPANADLAANFEIELVGEEDLNGVPTSLIELIPREEEFLRFAESIRLWVGQEDWIPIQQRLQPPGVNYVIVTYSAVELNDGLPDSTWILDLPDDVEVVKF
jgi:outer membrane lipoprotein-sorting protein